MRVRAALAALALLAVVAGCGGSSATPSPSSPPASAPPPSAAPPESLAPVEATPTPEVTAPPATGTTYVVKKDDTLYAIAVHFKITLKALEEANPSITDPKMLKVGQKLVIPAP